MTGLIIIAFIAWVLYCVSKAPNTDEGKLAALFTAIFTFIAWGALGLSVIAVVGGIFA